MKTVQMTIDEALLDRVDALVKQANRTRSEFIRETLHREVKRLESERLEREHRASFEREPQSPDENWQPNQRAWGEA
jgi:metal-responsive CopG/Arc/MetJ family transcriptional regulator